MIDEAAIARALRTYRIMLPRLARTGRTGGSTGTGPGGSLELHDFREYVPGDDVRQIDWNAMARTGQTIVRIRREEVSPRVEIVLDGSKSMAVTPAKSNRALELAVLLSRLSRQQDLDPALIVVGEGSEALRGAAMDRVTAEPFGAAVPMIEALSRHDALRTCGVRVVISDFLFEESLDVLCGRLARGAASVALVQLLDAEDLEPPAGAAATLIDSETGEHVVRELNPGVLSGYKRRLAMQQSLLAGAARRVHSAFATCVAQLAFDLTLRNHLLGTVLEVRA